MTTHIRHAQPSDLDPFTRLVREGMLDTYVNEDLGIGSEYLARRYFEDDISRRRYAEQLVTQPDRSAAWVAYEDGASDLLGAITTRLDNDRVQIQKLYINRAARGQGLGPLLLHHAFDHWGHARPYEVEVIHYNQPAIDFYAKHGFSLDEGEPIRYDHLPADHWPIAQHPHFWLQGMVKPPTK